MIPVLGLERSACWSARRKVRRLSAPCSGCFDLRKSVGSGPGCIREGCMSTYLTCVGMSTYVRCVSMSTYVSCENCVYKEGCLTCFVFFFSSCNLLYSIRNFKLDSVSSFTPFPPFRRHSSSAVRLTVRHIHLTLSVSVSRSRSRSRSCFPLPVLLLPLLVNKVPSMPETPEVTGTPRRAEIIFICTWKSDLSSIAGH